MVIGYVAECCIDEQTLLVDGSKSSAHLIGLQQDSTYFVRMRSVSTSDAGIRVESSWTSPISKQVSGKGKASNWAQF